MPYKFELECNDPDWSNLSECSSLDSDSDIETVDGIDLDRTDCTKWCSCDSYVFLPTNKPRIKIFMFSNS